MPTFTRWKFAQGFDLARRGRLLDVAKFRAVVDAVLSTVQNVHLEPCFGGDIGLRSCVQPVFTLSISPSAFDAFFNSPRGYRGQYLADPNLGLAANLTLVEALKPLLLSEAGRLRIAELENIKLSDSLEAASCKVWVHEDDFPFQSPMIDLNVSQWVDAAQSGIEKAKWGLCAPLGSRIQVKGALLNPQGHEIVPRTKISRRYEIWRFGFS